MKMNILWEKICRITPIPNPNQTKVVKPNNLQGGSFLINGSQRRKDIKKHNHTELQVYDKVLTHKNHIKH